MIYTSKANQLYRLTDDEVKGLKAKLLFVRASSDTIFPPELSRRAAERYKVQGGVYPWATRGLYAPFRYL